MAPISTKSLQAIRVLITCLALSATVMDLSTIKYTIQLVDTSSQEIPFLQSRVLLYAPLFGSGLLALCIFGVPFFLPSLSLCNIFSTAKSRLVVILALALTILYGPLSEICNYFLMASAIHAVSSFNGTSKGLVATYSEVYFCGAKADFAAAAIEHNLDGSDAAYLQCQITRVRAFVMIVAGLLVVEEAFLTWRVSAANKKTTPAHVAGKKKQ